jgi:hypothetical protein
VQPSKRTLDAPARLGVIRLPRQVSQEVFGSLQQVHARRLTQNRSERVVFPNQFSENLRLLPCLASF